jgi:hypothetical protein
VLVLVASAKRRMVRLRSVEKTATPPGVVEGAGGFVVQAGGGGRRAGQPVHHDVGQYLVAVDRVPGGAAESVQSLNILAIQASWPIGESCRADASVCGRVDRTAA